MSPAQLRPYKRNAKLHPPEQVERIAASIREFGFRQPIVVDVDNVVIMGHGRLLAAKQLGLERVPVAVAADLSPAQVKALRLADNKTAESEWDLPALEVELAELPEFDMSALGFDMPDGPSYIDNFKGTEKRSLADVYIAPPFSVLDARQGYWRDRREYWDNLIGDASTTRTGGAETGGGSELYNNINGGTSNFDPVLAETMLRWFCKPGGKVLDPWGGEQTKGVVSGALGYGYHGVEIRPEQVAVDQAATAAFPGVRYTCGDSEKIADLIQERGFDMLLPPPPYYDIEVYSKEDMSALPSYEEFLRSYRGILTASCGMLADGAFAVLKVGDIRDKRGILRGFVPDTIAIMQDAGLAYYNEIVLVQPFGTAGIRAAGQMRNRKVVKCHQNVLVFYKGNVRHIQKLFRPLEFPEGDDE